MAGPDRKNALLAQDAITGIDFVAVDATQTVLDVFFLTDPLGLQSSLANLVADQVTITGDADDPDVPVATIAFAVVDARNVLRVTTTRPGGWGRYWFAIADARIDPYYARLEIDFKAACPSKLDCAPPAHECPPEPVDDILVDAQARDFWSVRRALLDFAAQRNPRWADRLEADVGVMLVETMAAMADELAYYQDRISRETRFTEATQRRSLRRHARLVDHEPEDGSGARGWVAADVDPLAPGFQLVPAGTQIWARAEGARPLAFEVGAGLADSLAGTTYRVAASRNHIPAHLWDADDVDAHSAQRPLPALCLPVGATSLHIRDHHAADLSPGDTVFIVTEPEDLALPRRCHRVTLTAVVDTEDPLGVDLMTETEITRIDFAEPIPFELDLRHTAVLGNALPITAGLTRDLVFAIGASDVVPSAIERSGPNSTVAYLMTLPDKDGDVLVRLDGQPEMAVQEIATGLAWDWRRALLGTNSSTRYDRHFTLDDGTWDRAVTFQRIGETVIHRDYLAGIGTTLRFGDGEFGRQPAEGAQFSVVYRLGNGARGNVPANAVRFADPNGTSTFADVGIAFLRGVTNPQPTAGGRDAETTDEIRRDAPVAYRAVTHRAVRPEDFDEIAQRLDWVQRAGTQFRWTGSWLTAFTAADARGTSTLDGPHRRALEDQLDRHRQAGREVHVLAPRYANLDLRIRACVAPSAYPGDVVLGLTRALLGRKGVRPVKGFFDPDHFTFGTPLDRSELEAAIQRVPGVLGVKAIWIARRGWFAEHEMNEAYYHPAADEVIRVDNDPRHPDRGTVTIETEGGA